MKIKKMDKEKELDRIEISRGYIGGILLAILMFAGIVSGIYAGDCEQVDLSGLNSSEDILYIVVGNSSNLDGMNITFNNITQNATICFVVNYKPDNFTLVFFNNVTNEVVTERVVYRGGGGGGSTSYIYKNITQNKTIYVPEYIEINNSEICDTEICDIEVIDDDPKESYNFWPLIVVAIITIIICWYIMRETEDEECPCEEEIEIEEYKYK